MARQTLRPVARIFTKKRSATTPVAGMLVVALSLGVAGFGIATAIYLEHPLRPAAPQSPQASDALPAPPHDPLAAAAAVPIPPEPAAGVLPAIEPQAGSTAPQPAESAALEAPPPAAASAPAVSAALPAPRRGAESKSGYWVEYGAFAGERYARRLQQALSRQGLDAVIVATHARDGRKLLRVRSAPLTDLATARQAAAEAQRRLRLAALVHRGSPTAAPERHYWVQFAAFAKPKPAARLSRTLRRGGVAASVSSVRAASGKSLYLVRSPVVAGRAKALALGERGRLVAQTDFLIGERLAEARPHPARGPPRPVADSR